MSSPYVKQHFVPKFLLRQWVGGDGKIACHYWSAQELVVARSNPGAVAYKNNLLNYRHRKDVEPHLIESMYMGPKIDGPGSLALIKMQTATIFTNDIRKRFAPLVASLIIRDPDMVKTKIRTAGSAFLEILEQDQPEYEQMRGSNDPLKITDFLHLNMPGFSDDVGIAAIPDLIKIISNRIVEEMEWAVVATHDAPFELLIGDRPVIATEETNHPQCILVLPISPRHLFIAGRPSREWNLILNSSPSKLVSAVNKETSGVARTQVFGVDDKQLRFVANRLAKR